MPLPKPPTKRADMLTDVDFASQPKAAKTSAKSPAKSAPTGSARQNVAAILSAPTPAPTLELVKPAMTPAAAPAAAVNEGSRSARRGNRKTTAPAAAPVSVAPAPAPIVADKGTGSTGAKPTSPSPTAAPVSHTGPSVRRKRDVGGPAKLFVLDTNVLLHDPMSLFRFDEHDIYLPMITLEELDGHKKGMTEVARNARQV
ncbi:MAG: PhoH family protein, partial [Aquabacterium sp.]|nr:PhoH family protein [Aquabacterium sp.]